MSDPAARQLVLSDAVPLDQPIVRGEQIIAELRVRKPQSGELRGLSLVALGQLEVDELIKVLPRVCSPPVTAADVSAMDPADLLALGAEVAGFLLPTRARTASPV